MRDVESLLASVREAASRRQLSEAVRAYQAGAFRAAIISTWVAVALDLVGKLRELAEDGDAAATTEIANLDAAIAGGQVPALRKFEHDLLDLCRDTFELINGRDHLVLERLIRDRNSCAHPAFVAPDEVFAPTAELARAHLAAAVDAVLQHPPTPGKRVVDRFKAEIGGGAWPSSHDDLVDYLRERYFGQQRDSAKRQLAQLIIKCSLGVPVEAPNRPRLLVRYPQCARALNDVAPGLLTETIATVVGKREESSGLSEDAIRFGVGSLGDLAAFWEAIPKASGSRIVTCIETSTTHELVEAGVFAVQPPAVGAGSEVGSLVEKRIAGAASSELAGALALRVSSTLVDAVVTRVETSANWGTTNTLLPLLPALVPFLEAAHIQGLCAAAITNYEIYQAHSADSELTRLFTATMAWEGVRESWVAVAGFNHPHQEDPVAAFPGVRTAVAAAWGVEVLPDGHGV